MARTVTSPPPVPISQTVPGREIAAVTVPAGGGLAKIAESLNSLWWLKAGSLVCDCGYASSDGVLSTTEARDRRYYVRPNHYADHSGDHIQVYIDAVYSTGTWEIAVHTGAESSGTLTISSTGLYNAGTYEIDDTVSVDEVRIEYISNASANNYAKGIFVAPYLGKTALDAGSYSNGASGVVATDLVNCADEKPASTFMLAQMADMAQNIYERRTGMLYACGRAYDLTTSGPSYGGLGGSRTLWAAATLWAAPGSAGWYAYVYVSFVAVGTSDLIWYDVDTGDTQTVSVSSTGWKTLTINAPSGQTFPRRVIYLAGRNLTLQSTCIEVRDATY